MKPWRRVVNVEKYSHSSCVKGASSLLFTLECGHVSHNKTSQGYPKRKRCKECPNV